MRKRNMENKTVKRAITWIMAMMIAVSTIGGNLGALTVYAEETEENGTSTETNQGGESSAEVAAATTAVDNASVAGGNATTAANAATDAVKAATDAVAAVETAVSKMENAAKEASEQPVEQPSEQPAEQSSEQPAEQPSGQPAEPTPEQVENYIEESIKEGTQDKLDAYNKQVVTDQTTINEISQWDLETVEIGEGDNKEVIVETVSDGEGTKEVTLKEYIEVQVGVAQEAAKEAEKGLEAVLECETKEEAKDKIGAVKDAAEKAEAAYYAAEKAMNIAVDQKDAAIYQYNLYAMSYGLPKYGETEVTYTSEDAQKAIEDYNEELYENKGLSEEEVLEKQITYMGAKRDEILSEIEVLKPITESVQTAEVKVNEANAALASAENALATANDAKSKAEKAIKNIKNEEDKDEKLSLNDTLEDAKEVIKEADQKVDAAQAEYDEAVSTLAGLKNRIDRYVFDSVTLDALKAKIAAAEEKVEAAKDELDDAKAAKETAERYVNWVEELVKDEGHSMSIYSQIIIDENGNKVPVTVNNKEYDLTNELMKSRPVSDFILLADAQNTIDVPYAIYRDYVEALYKKSYDIKNMGYGKGYGVGSSTGNNLDKIYWELDENNKVTGNFYTSEDELETGRYFVGYAFKREGDGYHLDGIMFDYKKPEKPDNPDGENPDGETPDDTTPTGGGTTTGGGAGGGGRAAGAAGDVLGAKREDLAIVAEQGDVLGATRAPKTSDASKAILWMLVMGSSALGAAAVMASKNKEA